MDEYTSRVQRGREALVGARRNLWTLADIAAEFPPEHPGPGVSAASGGISEWAADLGVSARTAQKWRQTAIAWPPDQRRSSQSFTLHVELCNDPNRFERIDEVDEARDVRPSKSEQPTDEQVKKAIVARPELVRDAVRESAGGHIVAAAQEGMNEGQMDTRDWLEAKRAKFEENNPEGYERMVEIMREQAEELDRRELSEAAASIRGAIIRLQNAIRLIKKGTYDQAQVDAILPRLDMHVDLLKALSGHGADWDKALTRLTNKE